MTDKDFLNDWVGKTIHIATTDPPSTWTLEEKLNDKHVQVSAAEYHQSPGVSAAFAGFICRNVEDSKDIAFVRVFVQILYAGSDWAIHGERAGQSSENLPWHGREELDNLQALSASGCTSVPHLRAHEITKQGEDSDFVPGGFLHYNLLDKARGVQLDEETFWAYSREERDAIREGFRDACRYVPLPVSVSLLVSVLPRLIVAAGSECVRAGVYGEQAALDQLFWDTATGKVDVAPFHFMSYC
ncbi:hypothetical protein BJX62DRAFT_244224 [Aspergillus germanicus]